MPDNAIFGPVFAMFALTFVVWVVMYARRIRYLREHAITPEQLQAPSAVLAAGMPAHVASPSDNLKNLFEMPVLFYALALVLFVTGEGDPTAVTLAWLFVAFRVLHSAVHCTINVVMLRFVLYLVSTCALWVLAARAAWRHFAA